MVAIFDPASYEPSLLSLPFAGAALGLLAMSFYVVLMRGARLLRAAFLCACGATLACTAGFVLIGSLTEEAAASNAILLFKLSMAPLPAAAAAVFAFEVFLVGQLARYRLPVFIACVMALVQAAVMLTTDLYLDGIWRTPLGLYLYRAGPLYPVYVLGCALWNTLALLLGLRYLRRERSPRRRKQIRGSLIAFGAFTVTAIDIPLGYEIGFFPLGWLTLCIGAVLALRSMILDALIDARVRDRRVPLAALYLLAAALGVWGVWTVAQQLPTGLEPDRELSLLVQVPLLILLYLALRVILVFGRVVRRTSPAVANTLLERLAEQHAVRMQHQHTPAEIAALTAESLELGLGCRRTELLLPARLDWSWHTVSGQTLSEAATPDPLTLSWFASDPQPVLREDLQARRLGEQRDTIERLFEANRADVIVPLVSRDEMVGMLILAEFERGSVLLPEEQGFLELMQDQTAMALDYAHMHREATARVEVLQQMKLAEAVQRALVPSGELIDCGAVRISGLWAPASRCGGDWWWVHELASGRVLVLIGDVTGHGLPAAMVTAAAKGCYDVAQTLRGDDLDVVELLSLLDAAVRTVGGETFHMTCFVTLLDPAAGQMTYANAGHLVPYVCRVQADGSVELGVLSARGAPLGAGNPGPYRAHTRELLRGDTLVWYTDGLVESVDRGGRQFGDRRLQRILRKIEHANADARVVRDHIVRAALAFQGGVRAEDDITLVVARVEAGMLPRSPGADGPPGGSPEQRDT
jgi:serine phosphatase RsbU (regulator of sigma subunit)